MTHQEEDRLLQGHGWQGVTEAEESKTMGKGGLLSLNTAVLTLT